MTSQATIAKSAKAPSTFKISYMGRQLEIPSEDAACAFGYNHARTEIMADIHRHNWNVARTIAKSRTGTEQAFWLGKMKDSARHSSNVAALLDARSVPAHKHHVSSRRRDFLDELKRTGWKPFDRTTQTKDEQLRAYRDALSSCVDTTFSQEVCDIIEGRNDGEESLSSAHTIELVGWK